MNRWMKAGAAAIVVACVVTGCSRPGDAGSDRPDVISSGRATGSVQIWAMGDEASALPSLAKTFEQANPGVKLDITPIPWGDASTKIQTAIAAGQTPDATMVGADFLPTYVAAKGLAAVPKGLVDPSSFFTGAWNGSVIDGVPYAVPWYVDTRVVYYRKDLAEKAGVAVPKNWDELKTFAKRLQAAGAKWGITAPNGATNSWQSTLPYFWQAGGSVLDKKGGFSLDSKAMVASLKFQQSLFKDGIANPDIDTSDGVQEFVKGTNGATVSGPWLAGQFRQAAGADWVSQHVGTFVLPAGPGDKATSYIGGGSWSVFKNAQNPDAAWKFIRWTAEQSTQQRLFQAMGDLPAVKNTWKSPALTGDDFTTVFGKQLQDAQGPPLISTWAQVGAGFDGVAEEIARGTITPTDAADKLQQAASSIGTGKRR